MSYALKMSDGRILIEPLSSDGEECVVPVGRKGGFIIDLAVFCRLCKHFNAEEKRCEWKPKTVHDTDFCRYERKEKKDGD